MPDNVLEMKQITKIFPGVKAVDKVDFSVRKGEVHALLGENGAGKSTLMKILAGVYHPEEGSIFINGEPVELNSRKKSQEMGVAMIFQELSVLPNLDVAGNLFLAREKTKGVLLDFEEMEKNAREILNGLGLELDPKKLVGELSIGERQIVEIARAISSNAKIIVMDEPTSALTREEQEKLFKVIEKLKNQGTAIIYVSHRMDEIFSICDRLTVLRDGKKVGTALVKDVSSQDVIAMMIGEKKIIDELSHRKPKNKKIGEPVLELEGFSGNGFTNINFTLHKGEILGLSGLLGSGRSEILRAICGLDPTVTGTIKLQGRKCSINSIQDAIKNRILMVPEDRRNEGIVPGMSVLENLTLTHLPSMFKSGVINAKDEQVVAEKNIRDLKIAPGQPDKAVGKLSGGNQQKVVISRCLNHNPLVLLLDEPTQGIDVVAKSELHTLFRSLAEQGMGIIIVSSELPELVSAADRVIVLYEGQVKAILTDDDIEEKRILHFATGGV